MIERGVEVFDCGVVANGIRIGGRGAAGRDDAADRGDADDRGERPFEFCVAVFCLLLLELGISEHAGVCWLLQQRQDHSRKPRGKGSRNCEQTI